jgi:membrane-associated phospholipid phosphatase
MNSSDLARRILAEWKIKLFLGGAITVLFWLGYFHLGYLSRSSARPAPELSIDRMIPFMPGAAFLYLSEFVILPLIVWLMTSRRQLLACCRGLSLLIGVSFFIFCCWPTRVMRPNIPAGQFYFYDLVASTDLTGNALPSLHAGFGLFAAACAWDTFQRSKYKWWLIGALWVWTVAIMASTLLIKQHVFLDLAAGGALGLTSWAFAGRASDRIATLNINTRSRPASGPSPPAKELVGKCPNNIPVEGQKPLP